MDIFLSHLADHCRTHVTKNKWVLVPSLALGHTLGERLAWDGPGWANLRFTTPTELARQIAAPFLIAQGSTPTSDGIGPALMMRLMVGLPSPTPTYFRPMAHQPKMAAALWRAISELRMAGITATTLARSSFPAGAKRDELTALLHAYEHYLREGNLVDHAAVLQEALGHLEASPIRSDDHCLELPDVLWHPLQRQLIHALPGTRISLPTIAVPGLALPRRARLSAQPNRLAPSGATDAECLAFVLEPNAAPPTKGDGTVQLFRAGSREGEVEEVFRRMLAERIPLDCVELACASHDALVLVWEKAARYDWPVTIGPGVPMLRTRPARALLAFCAWIHAGFPAEGLRRLLQSGDLCLGLDDALSEGQAARLLTQSGATWGRQTYASSLTRLATLARTRAGDVERDAEARAQADAQARRADRLAEWLAGLLTTIPPSESEAGTLEPWLEAMVALTHTCTATGNALDAAARTTILQALDDLRVMATLPRTPRESLDLIRETIEPLTVESNRPRPGHLYVTTLSQAGSSGRDRTFLMNLEEGVVFPAPIEDPVLLDTERVGLSEDLPTSQDRSSEALFAIVSRLAALRGRVTLSFACSDTREQRETFPSWLLLQALRVLHPDHAWTYDDLNTALGEPVSTVPARPELALSDTGWWLSSLRGQDSVATPSVLDAFPHLRQGANAQEARQSDQFTIFDGWVATAGPRLDPRVTGQLMSASQLEDVASCPFRYFLKHGLHISAPEEATPDPDVWLDPATRGSLLHELYAQIWRTCATRQERPDPARHHAGVRDLVAQRLARLRVEMPPPSEEVFERERQQLFDDLAFFLEVERDDQSREPIGHEVAFGIASDGQEPLADAEPVTIRWPNGTSFRLRGRIDRLDQLADGSYEVVDYKTGRPRLAGGLQSIFAGGRQLQPALYGLAASELLTRQHRTGRVSGGSYYFPTRRGRGERVPRPLTDPTTILTVLNDLLAVMRAGVFTHTQDPRTCEYCEFHRACGNEPAARTALKMPNAQNTPLNLFKALANHV